MLRLKNVKLVKCNLTSLASIQYPILHISSRARTLAPSEDYHLLSADTTRLSSRTAPKHLSSCCSGLLDVLNPVISGPEENAIL